VQPAEHRAGGDATFSRSEERSITALVGATGVSERRSGKRKAILMSGKVHPGSHRRNHPLRHPANDAAKFEHDSAPGERIFSPQLHSMW